MPYVLTSFNCPQLDIIFFLREFKKTKNGKFLTWLGNNQLSNYSFMSLKGKGISHQYCTLICFLQFIPHTLTQIAHITPQKCHRKSVQANFYGFP